MSNENNGTIPADECDRLADWNRDSRGESKGPFDSEGNLLPASDFTHQQ